MRIIGGSARGARLKTPRTRGIRPTSDRVRQSIFDLLGQRMDGLRVLDLFAGTGALGLEALSRGAAHCTFVERDRRHARLIRQNLRALGFEDRARVVVGDALSLRLADVAFDLVFADPPYAMPAERVVGRIAAEPERLLEGARVVVEHDRRSAAPARVPPLCRTLERRYGDTMVSLYRVRDVG
ncbi:MAG: 16S rRNA (guanine(966)-N(2))-methyltransferase RsmD [Deltaproteobacteria bacterium]|nr:MAG: 16S rRNA (guanine(966)-N(2))-methyltransferase RsmD [Deltaproteobacteria bacterium]